MDAFDGSSKQRKLEYLKNYWTTTVTSGLRTGTLAQMRWTTQKQMGIKNVRLLKKKMRIPLDETDVKDTSIEEEYPYQSLRSDTGVWCWQLSMRGKEINSM